LRLVSDIVQPEVLESGCIQYQASLWYY